MREATSNYFLQILVAEYQRRRGRNPRYSHRALARAVGLSSGFLSQMLRGRKRLSLGRGVELVVALGLGPHETNVVIQRLIALQTAGEGGEQK